MDKGLTSLIHSKHREFPLLMGIVNLTEDSFFDGGKYNKLDRALFQVEKLISQGADIIDLGAESSRPGASPVSLDKELSILIPVLEGIVSRFKTYISIDTYKPEVMAKSIASGAHMINDIYALSKPNALETALKLEVPICIMHMQNSPETMQNNPHYENLIDEVYGFLEARLKACIHAGIKKKYLIADVGFGFGKTFEHNFALLNNIEKFLSLEFPILVGLSQKSMHGYLLNNMSESRLIPSVICATHAARKGASILRVHDVLETKQALITSKALLNGLPKPVYKKVFFGTDGIRGRLGEENSCITPKMMTKLGWAIGKIIRKNNLAEYNQENQITAMVGKDTRISGYMLESALEAGLISSGVNVNLIGPMPTPAIAYLTKTFSCDIGIAITASHNPYTDNGVKFFSSQGEKLGDDIEIEIESLLDQPSNTNPSHLLGKAFRIGDTTGRYIEFCKSSFPMKLSLKGVRLVVDCANGANYRIAPEVFKELGAEVIAIYDQPNGLNINFNCGSNHPESLQKTVLENKADLGIGFDGDGDRVCLVDNQGNLINGDIILYLLAKDMKSKNKLTTKQIIGTKMTNMALEESLNEIGLELIRTDVGDRFIRQAMNDTGANLGGENSGHILYADFINTGDAIIASLQILRLIKESKSTLRELASSITLYPSLIKSIDLPNVIVQDKSLLFENDAYKKLLKDTQSKLGKQGRILSRASGTEPIVRVMVECKDENQCTKVLDRLVINITNLITTIESNTH